MIEEYEKLIPGYSKTRGISIEDATRHCERASLLMERMIHIGAAYAEFQDTAPQEFFFCALLFLRFGDVPVALVPDMMKYFYEGYDARVKQKEETPHEHTEHPAEAR